MVYNVSKPTITAYLPAKDRASGTAVIVAPGGAFHILSIDSEGIQVAKWLNERGVAAFVLKYRVVKSQTTDPIGELMPLMANSEKLDIINAPVVEMATQDGLTAVKYVREHSAEFGVKSDKIGFMGFSAGGTLTLSVVQTGDDTNRPNFCRANLSLRKSNSWKSGSDSKKLQFLLLPPVMMTSVLPCTASISTSNGSMLNNRPNCTCMKRRSRFWNAYDAYNQRLLDIGLENWLILQGLMIK